MLTIIRAQREYEEPVWRIYDEAAYMLTIIRAQREYEEPAWRIYDEAHRDTVASSGNKQWSKDDESIFAKVFMGRVRRMKWCSS